MTCITWTAARRAFGSGAAIFSMTALRFRSVVLSESLMITTFGCSMVFIELALIISMPIGIMPVPLSANKNTFTSTLSWILIRHVAPLLIQSRTTTVLSLFRHDRRLRKLMHPLQGVTIRKHSISYVYLWQGSANLQLLITIRVSSHGGQNTGEVNGIPTYFSQ